MTNRSGYQITWTSGNLSASIASTSGSSTFSNVMDAYPGMNALATLHDVLADTFVASTNSFPLWYNIGTMLPAAAFTYSALLNTSIGYGIVASHEANGGGP